MARHIIGYGYQCIQSGLALKGHNEYSPGQRPGFFVPVNTLSPVRAEYDTNDRLVATEPVHNARFCVIPPLQGLGFRGGKRFRGRWPGLCSLCPVRANWAYFVLIRPSHDKPPRDSATFSASTQTHRIRNAGFLPRFCGRLEEHWESHVA